MRSLGRTALMAILAASCKADLAPAGNDDPDVLQPEARFAALDAISAKAHALIGTTVDARRQELLAYIRSRREIAEAGESEDGSLWALFTDDRPLIIIANQPDVEPGEAASSLVLSAMPPAAAIEPELPGSVQARVLLGGNKLAADVANDGVRYLLRKRNYNIVGSGLATIDELKTVQGDGVFYFRGHGGYGYLKNIPGTAYAPMSATPASLLGDIKYKDDWDHYRLAYSVAITDAFLPFRNAPRGAFYAFTAEFVKTYFRFEPGSLVYMSACFSDGAARPEFKQEFLNAGAGGYWGYDGSFKDGFDNDLSQLVFDRLLGINEYKPESPKQRPFDSNSIKRWLVRESLDLTDSSFVELTYTHGTRNKSGPLAPSIEYMTMDETSNTLYLKGQFGEDMGGRAEVNGSSAGVTIKKWEKEQIQLQIPLAGAQAAGDVKVFSRNRESNPRTLTEWRITFQLSFAPGTGTLKWEGPIRARIRADVQDFRKEAAETPVYRAGVPIQITRDTDGDLTGSGDNGMSGTSKMYWEGTSHLDSRIANSLSPNPIDGVGEIDAEFRLMKLFFAVTSTRGMVVRQGTSSADLPGGWAYLGDGPVSFTNPLPAIYLPLANDFTVTADRRTLPVAPSPILSWPTVTPAHTPSDTTPRLVVLQAARVKSKRE